MATTDIPSIDQLVPVLAMTFLANAVELCGVDIVNPNDGSFEKLDAIRETLSWAEQQHLQDLAQELLVAFVTEARAEALRLAGLA